MKKIIAIVLLSVLCLALCACGNKSVLDPIQSIWAVKYNDGQSQIMFSFENTGNTNSGDLDICIWDYDEEVGDLKQSANFIGAYTQNTADNSFELKLNGNVYDFTYELFEKEKIIIKSGETKFNEVTDAFGSDVFELYYIRANEAN